MRPSEDLSEDLSEDPAPRARGAVVAIAPEPRADRLIDLGTARCERACEVYVQALLEAGWTRSQPRERWERQALVDAINTHLASGDDIHAALDELRRAVAEWVAAYRDRPTLSQGWSVRKFAEWLASARPTSSVRFRSEDAPTSQRARPQPSTAPEPDDEPFEPISPERQAEDQAFIESLARGGIPAPESHVNGEGMGVIRMPWFAASGAGR